MILENAKAAARKAREEQEERERQRENDNDSDQDSFPAHQPTFLPGPPAYEPAGPTSPSSNEVTVAGPSSSPSALPSDHPSVHTPLLTQPPISPSQATDPESQQHSELPPKRDSPEKRFFKAFCVAYVSPSLVFFLPLSKI